MNKEHYKKLGYCFFEGVLDHEEIRKFRSLVKELHSDGIEFPLSPLQCLQIDEIVQIAFSSKLVDCIRKEFHSDYIMFPDLEVQYNLIGNASQDSIFNGWHVDSNSEGIKEYLIDRNYGFAKVGIYFQDNDPIYAGGIDLVSGSHQFPKIGPLKFKFFIKKIINKLQILFKSKTIKTKAGDSLIFDSRLQHRSSRPNTKAGNISFSKNYSDEMLNMPPDREKVVLYFDIAFPNSCMQFWENAKLRASSKSYLESRHFSGFTAPNSDYTLFRKYASAQKVKTIIDILEK